MVLETSVVVPAAPKFYHLKGMIVYHSEDDFRLVRIFLYSGLLCQER